MLALALSSVITAQVRLPTNYTEEPLFGVWVRQVADAETEAGAVAFATMRRREAVFPARNLAEMLWF